MQQLTTHFRLVEFDGNKSWTACAAQIVSRESRKEYKPATNSIDIFAVISIELFLKEQDRELQKLEPFDIKTSSRGFKGSPRV